MCLLSSPQLSEKNNHHLLGLSCQQQQSGTGACILLLRLNKLSSPTTQSLLDQALTRKIQDSRSPLKTCTSDLNLCQDLQLGCFSTSSRLFNV
ncbi:hypothetical protein PCANC_06437, partial [Puccinia coronata f. sp. avenae]